VLAIRAGVAVPELRHTNKRRDAITDDEAAWLRNEYETAFVEFKRAEILQKLWDSANQETMYWKAGMYRPALIGVR
jgi:hypothetical protein